MTYLIARFHEASTYGALTGVFAALGLHLDPGVMQNITLVGTGIAGLLGILLRDRGASE
jgi:hypothetical protein